MAELAGKSKQVDPVGSSLILSTPFVHPNNYKPGLDAQRWRLIASEPINRTARRFIQREISALNWRIRPVDNEDANQRAAAIYYSEVFRDFRNLASRALKSACELPQGGAWEVGWTKLPQFGEGERGTLAFVVPIDAGTLNPTTDKRWPIAQINPYNQLERALFKEHEIVRILINPRDEFDYAWWQESPTEASYLAIEALARIYTYSLKQLMDTPPVGILDLMDFSEQSVRKWTESFRELIQGVDPIKIPVLYEHKIPAKYISLSNDFARMQVLDQFQQYAELVLSNYGLSIDDLRILGRSMSKAGAAVSQKVTLRSGVNFFAELIKDAVQSVLPDFLVFEYSEPDIEERRSMAQIRAADARTIQTLAFLPIRHRVALAKQWGVIDLDIDPVEIEKEAMQAMEALQAGQDNQAPGKRSTAMSNPRPGQLERGEGRVPDVLEDDTKRNAASSPRVFAKALIDKAGEAVRDFFLPQEGTRRYGLKKERAARQMEAMLQAEFAHIGQRITPALVAMLLDKLRTQEPRLVQSVNVTPPTAKSWTAFVDQLAAGGLIEKQDDETGMRIEELLDELLDNLGQLDISDEDVQEQLYALLTQAYEEGLLGVAETIQQALYERNKVQSPIVRLQFNVTDPRALRLMEEQGLRLVRLINEGTRHYLKQLILRGMRDGLGVDELTERIRNDLFGLPEASSLSQARVRSIVTTEMNRADTLGRLAQMKQLGIRLKRWITRGVNVCPLCLRNEAAGSVPLDYEYEDVFGTTQGPPGHPSTCHCSIGMDEKELAGLGTTSYWTGAGGRRTSKARLLPVQIEKAQTNGSDLFLFFLAKFPDAHALARVQTYLKSVYPDARIDWTPPGDFHVTLLYIKDADPTAISRLTMALDSTPDIGVETDGIGLFTPADGADRYTLYASVRPTPELRQLQARLAQRALEQGAELSDFSLPDQWKPHITLASSDRPFALPLPDLGGVGLGLFRIEATINRNVVATSDGYTLPLAGPPMRVG